MFIEHGDVNQLLEEINVTTDDIVKLVKQHVNKKQGILQYDNKVPKERVDVLLVEQGLFETREKAKRAIMAGLVYFKEEASR